MSATSQPNRKLARILFVVLLCAIVVSIALAAMHRKRKWELPESAKALKNPLQPSPEAILAAKQLYQDNCTNCHGERGKGDGSEAMMYDPAPADLTDIKRMSALSDGEIFYQITEGRKPMPSFKKRLTEEQRWQLVLLMRSFSIPGEKNR